MGRKWGGKDDKKKERVTECRLYLLSRVWRDGEGGSIFLKPGNKQGCTHQWARELAESAEGRDSITHCPCLRIHSLAHRGIMRAQNKHTAACPPFLTNEGRTWQKKTLPY